MTKLDKQKNSKIERILGKIFSYAVLIFVALLVLFPLYIVLVTSFMTKGQAMSPSFDFWPKEFSLHGYIEVFTYASGGADEIPTIVRGFINTMIVVIPTTLIGTFVSAMSAFAFSKLKFKGKNGVFIILLGTMLMPGTITLIPSYVLFDKLGWVDTFLPLIVPGLLGGASAVFFLRQFYFSIPNELLEAARVDGLSNFGIFIKIMIPLSMSAIIAQLVLAFVGGYNDYLGPLLYLQSPDKYTLQIALSFFRGTYSTDWAVVMAGAFTSLVPSIILYLFGQRFFIEGIASSGIKG